MPAKQLMEEIHVSSILTGKTPTKSTVLLFLLFPTPSSFAIFILYLLPFLYPYDFWSFVVFSDPLSRLF
jgi:hypothetical protein